jgi:hypothetical protein
MSLRDDLRRRTRRIGAAASSAWLLMPLSVAVTADRGPPPWLIALGVLVFGGAVLARLFGVRCPKRNTRFGPLAGEIAFHRGRRGRVDFCPDCGVPLDAPDQAACKAR